MYANFSYYQKEYCGTVIGDKKEFEHYGRKAQRRLDSITGNKLQYAFPTGEQDAEAVKDCLCELADFLCRLDRYQTETEGSAGMVEQEDGTVRGRVVTSVSSGSESVSYSAAAAGSTAVTEAAKDRKVADTLIYSMVKDSLGGVADANGVNLLYAGL